MNDQKTKKENKQPELASSVSSWATFKEEIPHRLQVSDVWQNANIKPQQYGTKLESAAEPGGTLIGRLAMRMTSRDIIDNLNLGPKAPTGEAKKARVADMSEVADDMPRGVNLHKDLEIPSSMMKGSGLHQQTKDLKASNFSNPIPEGKVVPGSNMADQAKNSGNVYNTIVELKHGDIPDSQFDPTQLAAGIAVEKEHTDDPNIAKQIAKAHLKEMSDYYIKLQRMEQNR